LANHSRERNTILNCDSLTVYVLSPYVSWTSVSSCSWMPCINGCVQQKKQL